MIWRPWVIASLGVLAFLALGALLTSEEVPTKAQIDDTVREWDRALRQMNYAQSQRRANLVFLGLSNEMADEAAKQIGRYESQAPRFHEMLVEQAAEMVDVFCPNADRLPQPYAALPYLVFEENRSRRVLSYVELRRFDQAPWYDGSLLPALYDKYERVQGRRADTTLMVISSALLGLEEWAMDGRSPWGEGLLGTWGFSRLASREPRVEQLAIEYFALMHFLVEVANQQDRGICAAR